MTEAIKHAAAADDWNSSSLHVDVTHRFPAPNRYSWELRPVAGLSVEESLVQFASWEEASKAGKLALNQFLQTPLGYLRL